MSVSKKFTVRRARSKRMAILMMIAMVASSMGGRVAVPTVHAQSVAPPSQGFHIDAEDLRFIYQQILVAQDHAAGGVLLGPGPNQVADPQLPRGLRTVDGSFNNLVPGQTTFGQADLVFPRLLTPNYRAGEAMTTTAASPAQPVGSATSYGQKTGVVTDSAPRLISNLIVDQTENNPAAMAAAFNPCGAGGFVCGGTAENDPITGTVFIPNITPDFGLSAPFNLMFTFFGQFFDHGLDLVTKGGGTVIMPLKADDPLIAGPDHILGNADDLPVDLRFMAMDRATNLPGPDGVMGTSDDVQQGINTTTPWVDQNQTYTSHPSHQVFLRAYRLAGGKPQQTGKVLDGNAATCAPRGTGIPGDEICNVGNWSEVKTQAATMLGIRLTDADVTDVPLLRTDPYGHFIPGPNGFAQMVTTTGVVEGNPAGGGTPVPTNARRTGHGFLNDIAHSAVPTTHVVGGVTQLFPDDDLIAGGSLDRPSPAGSYDDELLGLHFITGDGRGNENIALTMVHNLFHSEHNRLADDINRSINTLLTPAEITAWHTVHSGSGWDYGERLFQASRFVTEMEYQHLVFEEFARKMQPLINPFLGGITSINGAISAEFAHTVYRLGHSMLPEVVARQSVDGTDTGVRLFNAFLNPQLYNANGTLTADKAAGSLVRGLSQEVGNELDEFVTDSVRNTLVGLPLDLAAINIARGRSEGIPSLNNARKQFFTATRDAAVRPYANWFEFGLNLKHPESLVNFVAAYGTDPTITSAPTAAAKRAAAIPLVAANGTFMFSNSTASGLDNVDFWVGGLAERQAVFGGLLGSTFNFVFEKQLESLQDGDRFYYLQRTDGLNLRFQLEGNSFAELIRRNTDFQGGMDIIFNTADANLTAGSPDFLNGATSVDLGDNTFLLTQPDGTKVFFDPQHRGKNIVFNGGPTADRFMADIGDDTLYGNGGNDRMDGFEGNDTIHGGAGDDVLFGGNGDDVLKGGDGDDALSGGPGFGADLLIGGEGNDFELGGNDGVEYFGGGGNDILIDGTTRSEGIFGGAGDDWIEAGDGHDGGLFGDNGNVFDLLAGLDFVGGDDVLDGGPGQDGHFGEGGDDIMLMSEGTNKFFGDYGFDWITLRGWALPEKVELDLLANPLVQLNFNDLRSVYRFVDGASGWNLDDSIHGSNHVLCDPAAAEIAECLIVGMELTAPNAAKIIGLPALMGPAGFNVPMTGNAIPGIKGEGFMGGDILLGGAGSDILEGKQGDDLIDGDLWLNVQLVATLKDGSVKRVDHATDLIDDIFSDPQRLDPGSIVIEKSIVTPTDLRNDCGVAAPTNCDTAVFTGPSTEYSVILNANGSVTVIHTAAIAAPGGVFNDGTDILRNIEQLQFADGTIPAPGAGGGINRVPVPNVVGLSQAAATTALINADLAAGPVNVNSTTAAVGTVASQNPAGGVGVTRPIGTVITINVSIGALVPNVVNQLQANATANIAAAGLVVGSITQETSNTVAAGRVITQSPVSGTSVPPGTPMALAISLGVANRTVPNVVGQTQATATTNIQNAGLTVGAITNATSATIPLGSVISTTPAAGASVPPLSGVALVVSLGAPQPLGLVAALGFDEGSGLTAINTVNPAFNGTIRQAVRVSAGKIGSALQFDGVNDWVTITDTTASPYDLTTGMTIEAWVNPTVMSGWETILMKERGVTGEGLLSYALYAHDGAPLASGSPRPAGYVRVNPTATTTDSAVRGAAAIPLNTWTHLATTYDGTNQRFYVNGVLVGTTARTGSIASTNGAIRIGGNNSSTGEFFQGLIDEVRIYNRAISAAEIATDMVAPIVR